MLLRRTGELERRSAAADQTGQLRFNETSLTIGGSSRIYFQPLVETLGSSSHEPKGATGRSRRTLLLAAEENCLHELNGLPS